MTNDFWESDVLGRKENAAYLKKYLSERYLARRTEDGFVLAINAEWGLGKTFMLRCWQEELIHSGYAAVYFDAWKNDFTPEPLVAFISEIDEGFSPAFKNIPLAKKIFREAVKNFKLALKPAIKAVGMGVARHALGLSTDHVTALLDEAAGNTPTASSKQLMPSIDDIKKNMTSAVDVALKQHKNTKQAIVAFKEKLSLLVSTLSESGELNLPLFIFVDELDRCRPDYAIELLEGIKHLFGVPGVYFIVATNMQQLGESTKAIYGSGFDGHRYLKRFFDMEYYLPLPESRKYAESLFLNVTLPPVKSFVTFEGDLTFSDYEFLPLMFSVYADHFGCGLRDQFQAMKIFEAALYSVKGRKIHLHFLMFLTLLYQRSPTVYEEVFRSRAINEASGYSAILSKLPDVGFKIPRQSPNGQHYFALISPLVVAKIYLESIFLSSREININNVSHDEFPKTLINSLKRDAYGQEYSKHYVSEYFNIVRSAGAFSERIGT